MSEQLSPSQRANRMREQGMTGATFAGTNPNNVKLLTEGNHQLLPTGSEQDFQHKAGAAAVFLKEAEAATNEGEK